MLSRQLQYTMTFTAHVNDMIHVWMYSPAISGSPGHYVVIDDASLTVQ